LCWEGPSVRVGMAQVGVMTDGITTGPWPDISEKIESVGKGQ